MLLRSTTASINRSASGFVCSPAVVPASAPLSVPGRFRLSPTPGAALARTSASLADIEILVSYFRSFMFGPSSQQARTSTASADFCIALLSTFRCPLLMAAMQISPGMTHSPSRLSPSDLRRSVPCKNWALQKLACSPPLCRLYPLPVRRASALPTASSRFHLAMDTLAVQLTLPLAGCVEDFHLQVSAPCRAHKEEGRLQGRPFLSLSPGR
jgi:hypothetical protein